MQNQINPQRIRRGIFIVVSLGFVAALLIMVFTINTDTLRALSAIDPMFLAYAVMAVLLSWFGSILPFYILTRVIKHPVSFKDSADVYLGGSFFGFITPFGSGLLPAQIYILAAKGLSAGQATAVTTARATISSWLFGAIGLLMFLMFRSALPSSSNDILIGVFVLAVVWSLIIMFFIKRPNSAKQAVNRVTNIRILARYLGPARVERIRERLYGEIAYLSSNLKNLFSVRNIPALILVFLIEVVAWFALFAVLPLILFGLGYVENTPDIIFRLFILFTLAPVSPTPGGSGIVELAFTGFLVNLVPRSIIGLVVLLWRVLTYYLTLIVGGLVILRFAASTAREGMRDEQAD